MKKMMICTVTEIRQSLLTIKVSILYLFLLLHTHIHIQSILKAWRFFHSFLELILGLSLIKKILLH